MLRELAGFISSVPAPITFLVGVGLLLGGGRWLVEGAVQIAVRLGVSTLLIGLTVVAFGTSSPELFFNMTAALDGETGLSFGNVIGSNIANVTLVLGAAAVVAPITVHSRVVKLELPQLIGVTAGMLGLAWLPLSRASSGPAFTRIDGAILLASFALFSWGWFRLARQDRADPLAKEAEQDAGGDAIDRKTSFPVACGLFVLGLVLLQAGAKLTGLGAVGIAASLNIPSTVVGLTIVALATSLPEVVTSVVAAAKGHGDLAVGNVVGSNLFNILLVLGATSTVSEIPVPDWGWWDLGVMTAVTLVLLPIGLTNQRRIVKAEGVFLLVCYVAYLTFTIVRK